MLDTDISYISKKLDNNDFIGVVINPNDPTFAGRCQVRVLGLMDDIEDEYLPWATQISSCVFSYNGAGSISVPKQGTFVKITFPNGDIYSPEYSFIQNMSTQLSDLIKDDYLNTHVLVFDPEEELVVLYQPNSGFKISLKKSEIIISNDAMITISHANSDSLIQLKGEDINITSKANINIASGSQITAMSNEINLIGKNLTTLGGDNTNAVHPIARGDILYNLLETLASAIDAKVPSSATAVPAIKTAKKTLLNTNILTT